MLPSLQYAQKSPHPGKGMDMAQEILDVNSKRLYDEYELTQVGKE